MKYNVEIILERQYQHEIKKYNVRLGVPHYKNILRNRR